MWIVKTIVNNEVVGEDEMAFEDLDILATILLGFYFKDLSEKNEALSYIRSQDLDIWRLDENSHYEIRRVR